MKKILLSYFLHFVPMTKRVFALLFQKKNYPILTVLIRTNTRKNFQSFLLIELEIVNVLFLRINNYIYPIFHDNASLKITIPIEEANKEIELSGLGLWIKSKSWGLGINFR